MESRKELKHQKYADLPLTFDIPFVCSILVLIICCCTMSPGIWGREAFVCSQKEGDSPGVHAVK